MTMVIYTENRHVLNFKFYVGNTRPLPKESNTMQEKSPIKCMYDYGYIYRKQVYFKFQVLCQEYQTITKRVYPQEKVSNQMHI